MLEMTKEKNRRRSKMSLYQSRKKKQRLVIEESMKTDRSHIKRYAGLIALECKSCFVNFLF